MYAYIVYIYTEFIMKSNFAIIIIRIVILLSLRHRDICRGSPEDLLRGGAAAPALRRAQAACETQRGAGAGGHAAGAGAGCHEAGGMGWG